MSATATGARSPAGALGDAGRPRPASFARRWASAFADQAYFYWEVIKRVVRGDVFEYWHEVLPQAHRLAITTGSVLLIVGLVFAFGLAVGVQGVYGARLVGAPAVAGAFTAIANLRELVPFAFAYMVAAKVSTGYVAEIGTMRITEEIDAIDVQGIDSITFLCATRLAASLLILPALYVVSIAVAFVGSFIVVVYQIGAVSAGGYLALFWKYQNMTDFLFSGVKGLLMATFAVLVGLYYGYTVRDAGPAGVGRATAKAMVVNLIGIHLIAVLTSQVFWGGRPNLPIGG